MNAPPSTVTLIHLVNDTQDTKYTKYTKDTKDTKDTKNTGNTKDNQACDVKIEWGKRFFWPMRAKLFWLCSAKRKSVR